jgi:hypothetical protein
MSAMPDRRRGISILAIASVAGALAAGPAQGKTACAFEAQSVDKSGRGLALHEAPNAAAKVLGYVPNVEDKDLGPVGAMVQVFGAEDGWLLIEAAAGKGWVEGRSVTTTLYRETLKAAPDNAAADVAFLFVYKDNGTIAREPATLPVSRIVDCVGPWLEVEIRQPGLKTVSGAPASREGTVLGWTDRSCAEGDKDDLCRRRPSNYPWSPLPAGIVECTINVDNDDRRGLDVRAEPRLDARIVGRMPAPALDGPNKGLSPWAQVIGYKEGWFLIEGSTEGDELLAPTFVAYSGRGWVAANRVAVRISREKLKAAPDAAAADVLDLADVKDELPEDGDLVKPRRVLACSGEWTLVEFARTRGMKPLAKTAGPPDAVRGWAK